MLIVYCFQDVRADIDEPVGIRRAISVCCCTIVWMMFIFLISDSSCSLPARSDAHGIRANNAVRQDRYNDDGNEAPMFVEYPTDIF